MLTSFTQGIKSPKSPLKPSPFPVLYPISALTLCASSRAANQKCLWNLKAVAQRQPLGLNRAEWRIYSFLEWALHGMGVTAEQARREWGLFSRHDSLIKRKQIGVHTKDFLKQSSYQLTSVAWTASDVANFPSLGRHGEKPLGKKKIRVWIWIRRTAVQLYATERHPIQNSIKGVLEKQSVFQILKQRKLFWNIPWT